MKDRTNKIKIMLASGLFIYQQGVKSILDMIDLELEIIIESAPEIVAKTINESETVNNFIILDDLVTNATSPIREALSSNDENHILVLGKSSKDFPPNLDFLAINTHREIILEKLKNFLEAANTENKEEEPLLTERETEVLRHVALGLANKEIADRLFISINTVITHRKNITEKLEIKTIAGLTVYAIINKIIEPDEVKF